MSPLSEQLLAKLACPACTGPLEYKAENAWLDCMSCKLRYRIVDDIPVLLIEEANPIQ
ncbi:MAG TPA: Trm112 family protein [Candidatus Acidoferrum sp.]|nr:Trm112 family protein [Candidatus Acidoferrum sp.]